MATKEKNAGDDVVDVTDLAKGQVEGAATKGREKLEELQDEASEAAGRTMLREAPYAAVGLGKVVTDAARHVDAASLPERLRRAPSAVASRASALGTNAKVAYLALAARGHAARLQAAGDDAATEVAEQAQDMVDLTQEGVEDAATSADEATGGRAKAWFGRVKGAATRSSKNEPEDGAAADDADELEELTVAELRDQASELDIEGRTNMRKQELIAAIRDAT
jgi:hypothetical protein